ncbi:hypothetical protein ACFLXI_00340 [Chloroflexota bacterium]
MPDNTCAKLVSNFKQRVTPHMIPQAVVPRAGEKFIGTANLVQHDMSTRMNLSPWMAVSWI